MDYASLADVRRYALGVVNATDIRVVGELAAASATINGVLARRYSLPLLTAATGSAAFGGAPADGDTIIVGDKTYRYKDTLAAINDVKRTAGDAAACAAALASAIDVDPQYVGTRYYTGTTINGYCTASVSSATVTLTARAGGAWGNSIILSSASSAITETAFSGGVGAYSLLRSICVDLAQAIMIRGQATAAIESGTQRDAVSLWDLAMKRLRDLVESGTLTDDSGTIPGAATGSLPDSTTRTFTPEVGTREPESWGWDSDRTHAEDV